MENNANVKFKDSMFRQIFSRKEEIIPLYNQISGNNLDENTEVEIITLTDTMFMKQVNDLGFRIEDKLVVLMEQQSTFNQNMPLRMLMYVAREYEKILDNDFIYADRMVKIPQPEFYMLYNGRKRLAQTQSVMRISDMYVSPSDDAPLELKVNVIDINSDEFMSTLENTSLYQYIVATKALQQGYDNKKNLKTCIEELIKQNILKDFLLQNANEVVNMLTFNYDQNAFGKVKKQEGKAEGRAEGRAEAKTEDIIECYRNGISIKKLSKIFKMPEDEIKRIVE